MTGDIPITVVIPSKNEEKNLPSCLERLSRFREVIVVDSASSDRTVEIAKAHGASVINFTWDGQYPKKRNWLLLNYRFKTDWVLFLDADEFINEAFCDTAIRAVAKSQHHGYWLNYTNYFMGRALKHGLPQRKLALFRIGSGLYERIEEKSWSKLDMEIHEHPIIEGSVGEIKAPIDHRDFRGIEKFIERHRDYAIWEAKRFLSVSAETANSLPLTARQKFKYANCNKWWYPWFYFFYTYGARGGFLDGSAGFYYAFYKAWYFCSIRLLIKEER